MVVGLHPDGGTFLSPLNRHDDSASSGFAAPDGTQTVCADTKYWVGGATNIGDMRDAGGVFPLLQYEEAQLLGEKHGCVVEFHTRVIFIAEEVPTYQHDGVVSARLHGGLWECDSARRAWRAQLHKFAEYILAASSKHSLWRAGLTALADMYLATPTIFLEVLFSLPKETAFENNFAAIVPVTMLADGTPSVQPPFNGFMWEKRGTNAHGKPLGITPCVGAEVGTCESSAAQALFDKRSIMYYGMLALSPFNKTPRCGTVQKDMYSGQNMFTYHFMYAIHSDIGQTHLWMKEHEVPLEFVCNVLRRAFSRIGSDTCFCEAKTHDRFAKDRFIKDLILQSIAYCIHETDLGIKSYRSDLCGEDVRTRTLQRLLTANSPLIPGGDCEDQAQTFAQLMYTAKRNITWLLVELPMYADIIHYIFNLRWVSMYACACGRVCVCMRACVCVCVCFLCFSDWFCTCIQQRL